VKFLRSRPHGTHPSMYRYILPPEAPSSTQLIIAAIRRRLADGAWGRLVRMAVERNIYVVGEHAAHCTIDPSANCANAIFNATSGRISVGAHAFFGHGVSLLAGTHDVSRRGRDRMTAIPREGFDIFVSEGVWLASNVTIIGPCAVGRHAVVCAGAVVTSDVPDYAIVAGVPARVVGSVLR